MRAVLISLSLFASLSGYCKDGDYSILLIPKELLKNANVVKRMEEIRFEVINTGETVLYRKYALTILNEAGDEHAAFASASIRR